MRASTEICSAGSSTFGRCLARSIDRLKRAQEAEEIDFELRLVAVAGQLGHPLVGALPLRRPHLLALVQELGGRLELLMLEQTPHQPVARIFFLAFNARRRFRAGQEHLRLDVDERRGHDEIVAGDVEVELLHQADRVEVLLRDERDRDIVDVHLVLLDEVQQQIERSLELLEPDGKGVGARFEILMGDPSIAFIGTQSSPLPAPAPSSRPPRRRRPFRSFEENLAQLLRACASTAARRSRMGAR